ncbi:hypothetical protein [Streptomyces pristinaespiralis]|uniref:hypothetical protein n=1 Tax=Streptomyces pristinaespiralis TaxID=38300 RepID=UPI003838829F
MKVQSKPQILIVSNPDDETTRVVAEKIRKLSGLVAVVHPEDSGDRLLAAMKMSSGCMAFREYIRIDGTEFDLSSLHSVWYRRPRTPAFPALNPEERGFAIEEWSSFWRSLYGVIEPKFWVSDPRRLQDAARKSVQAAIAVKVGFRIPNTLVTNDPAKAIAFYEEFEGRVVAKSTGTGWMEAEGGQVTCFLTNRVSADDIRDASALKVCPVTLQEEIAKEHEVRVNVVGHRVLAVKIESQRSPISELDWRRYDIASTPYSAVVLPEEVADRCREITFRLGLNFGAIDLIRTPDGEYVSWRSMGMVSSFGPNRCRASISVGPLLSFSLACMSLCVRVAFFGKGSESNAK